MEKVPRGKAKRSKETGRVGWTGKMLEQVREQAAGMLDRGHSHSKSLGGSRDCEEARVWPEHKEHTKGSDQRREGTGGGGAITRGFAGRRVDSAHPD